MSPAATNSLLLTHAAATWLLVGLIWMVQLVHYPLFARVGPEAFAAYEREHQQRITWIVAPAMFVELAAVVGLLLIRPAGVPGWMLWTGAALCGVNWASTFLIQVPLHERLGRGFDVAAIAQLVASNWIRTAAWTLRGLLALAMVSGPEIGRRA